LQVEQSHLTPWLPCDRGGDWKLQVRIDVLIPIIAVLQTQGSQPLGMVAVGTPFGGSRCTYIELVEQSSHRTALQWLKKLHTLFMQSIPCLHLGTCRAVLCHRNPTQGIRWPTA